MTAALIGDMAMKRNSTDLKRRMTGRWLSAFSALAPRLDQAMSQLGENVPCPISGGTDGFRLFKDANLTGGGVKQAERVIPEGIDMLMWVNEWDFKQAYDELEEWLDGKPVHAGPDVTYKPKVVDETGLRRWLNQIWADTLPLDHTMSYPARAYLSRRRVLSSALAASDIRFHPNLHYKGKGGVSLGHHPAIVCLVRNNDGKPVGLHRTFIQKSGMKAVFDDGHKPRKLTPTVLKHTKGRVIRTFCPDVTGVLGIAEGLETSLAVYDAKAFPVWPGLSNTMLHGFVPPPGVHTVINFLDKDRNQASENSAVVVREHLEPKGITVIDLMPPTPILDSDEKGVDWADQLIRDRSGFDLLDQTLECLGLTVELARAL